MPSAMCSLAELGQIFSEPGEHRNRQTYMLRGRKVAERFGLEVITVDRHSFVYRTDVERITKVSS